MDPQTACRTLSTTTPISAWTVDVISSYSPLDLKNHFRFKTIKNDERLLFFLGNKPKNERKREKNDDIFFIVTKMKVFIVALYLGHAQI